MINAVFHKSETKMSEPEMMSKGGEIKIPRMRNGGFNPASLNLNINDAEIQRRVNESVQEYLAQANTVGAQDVQAQIEQALSGLPEGITEADVQRIIDANPGLTEDMVLTLIENNQGISLQDMENAISTAMANVPTSEENIKRLRQIAEELFYEDYAKNPDRFMGDREGKEQAELRVCIKLYIKSTWRSRTSICRY